MKRTAELSLLDTTSFSRPLHGLWFKSSFDPSAEALGYFHSVRFADVENNFCSKASPSFPLQAYPPILPFPGREYSNRLPARLDFYHSPEEQDHD